MLNSKNPRKHYEQGEMRDSLAGGHLANLDSAEVEEKAQDKYWDISSRGLSRSVFSGIPLFPELYGHDNAWSIATEICRGHSFRLCC